jgi:hypothetical protein
MVDQAETLTIREAELLTGIGQRQLNALMDQGRLPYRQILACRLIPKRALIRLLAQRTNKPRSRRKRRRPRRVA